MARTDRTSLVFMVLISLTPILSIHFPRFLAFWPLIIGLGFTLWFFIKHKDKPHLSKPYYICAGIISILTLISTLWSISPENALEDAIKASAIILFGGLFIGTCQRIDTERLLSYWWLFPAATVIAALLCAFDLATDMPIYHILHEKTQADDINTSVMNRGIVCLVVSYFLSMFFLQNLPTKRKYMIGLVMTAIMLIPLSLSQSQSGQLLLGVGLIVFFLTPLRLKLTYHFISACIIAGILLTPYIAPLLFHNLMDYAHANPWLYDAYIGNRTEIWAFVMDYAMQNPLYGFGIEATKYVPEFEHDYVFHEQKTILHPHNFSVQIWIEFGVFGALVFSGLLTYAIQKTKAIHDHNTKRITTTTFIVMLLFASMTYGLWQSWWLGEIILILGICCIFCKMPVEKNEAQNH